jgi:hypothetical protein
MCAGSKNMEKVVGIDDVEGFNDLKGFFCCATS